jgi:aminoglycoside-2''-adenylyltransferase
VDSTATALARITSFARAVKPDLPAIDVALAAVREVFARLELDYVLVGGLAVIHHGYVRATRDIDLLVERDDLGRVERLLGSGGFERTSQGHLCHSASGVDVDLLFAGDPIPPRERARFPSPAAVGRSTREGDVVDLPWLVALKLHAGRHRDLADVVGLIQELDEGDYLRLEAAVNVDLRPRLLELRTDALEERRWRDRDGKR